MTVAASSGHDVSIGSQTNTEGPGGDVTISAGDSTSGGTGGDLIMQAADGATKGDIKFLDASSTEPRLKVTGDGAVSINSAASQKVEIMQADDVILGVSEDGSVALTGASPRLGVSSINAGTNTVTLAVADASIAPSLVLRLSDATDQTCLATPKDSDLVVQSVSASGTGTTVITFATDLTVGDTNADTNCVVTRDGTDVAITGGAADATSGTGHFWRQRAGRGRQRHRVSWRWIERRRAHHGRHRQHPAC